MSHLVKLIVVVLCLVLLGTYCLTQIDIIPETIVENQANWKTMLVNYDHAIPSDWVTEETLLSNGRIVDTRMYPFLQQMFDDMRAQGVYPIVLSGYRTGEKQQSLMDDKINEFIGYGYSSEAARAEAKKWVSEVGHSEHQTGLAVDINSDSSKSTPQEVFAWLSVNAWKYGFVLRYPENKVAITHIDSEPWHYRYVGTEVADIMYHNDLCLEEYVESLPVPEPIVLTEQQIKLVQAQEFSIKLWNVIYAVSNQTISWLKENSNF